MAERNPRRTLRKPGESDSLPSSRSSLPSCWCCRRRGGLFDAGSEVSRRPGHLCYRDFDLHESRFYGQSKERSRRGAREGKRHLPRAPRSPRRDSTGHVQRPGSVASVAHLRRDAAGLRGGAARVRCWEGRGSGRVCTISPEGGIHVLVCDRTRAFAAGVAIGVAVDRRRVVGWFVSDSPSLSGSAVTEPRSSDLPRRARPPGSTPARKSFP
jgi:hypothetical protein